MSIEKRLKELGITLPTASNPAANYTNCVRSGSLLFVSGKGPLVERGAPPKVRLQGFVNAVESFEEHPQVLNGCSDLMVEVFGERGVHARSVLGASSLRANLPIVIESQFEVR